MKIRLLLLSHIFPLLCISQSISGIITDEDKKNLPLVNISISGESGGQVSNELGEYILTLKPNKSIVAIFSSVGYKTEKIRIPMLKKDKTIS